MFKGIDAYNMGVRDVNGNIVRTPIDWAKAKQTENGAFAMLKATLGTEIDWSFLANYAECKRVGMPIGAYHWLYANTVAKAHQEAQYFINAVKGKQFEYPVFLDIEDDPSCPTLGCLDKELLTDIVIAWLTDVQNAGYYVMWYANPDWRRNHLNVARLTAFDSMLACYDGNTPETKDYSKDCGIWQYSSKGTLDGISNHYVDLDVAYKDYPAIIKSAGLNGWGKSAPVAAPAPAPQSAPAAHKHHVGENVRFSSCYTSSTSANGIYASKMLRDHGVITKVLDGAPNPYLLDGGLCWVKDTQIFGSAAPAPAPQAVTYVVKPGDTLGGIATKYGTTYQHLAQINGIANPNLIGIGKKIKIR